MAYQINVVDLACLPPAGTVLSEKERAFYETFRVPKRKMEWLGGRLALKQLVQNICAAPFQAIEVLPHADGKPVLQVGGKESALAFSITHSHGFAVAAVSADEPFLGIDLEKVEHRIDAWAKDFFHPSELTGQGDAFLTALWTQKEALVKVLGTGLSLNSYDVRCVRGKAAFFGSAFDVYQKLGSPRLTLETSALVPGFIFTVAHGY